MSTFTLDLQAFVEKVGDKADLVVRKIGIDILSSVVRKSPVDRGRFKANWTVAIGAADASTTERVDKTGDSTISVQGAKLDGFHVGPSIWILNSLPYATRLENGYSQQAPLGFVRLTVSEYQSFVDKAVKSA